MDFQEKKIFRNIYDKRLEAVNIPSDIEYYNFIQKKSLDGLRQIIITSDLMLKIIKEYFLNNKAKIISFELMQDDEEFYINCKKNIEKMNCDRGYFQVFFEQVKYLYSKECIDIKSCRFKYRNENDNAIDITLYINGNLSIGKNDSTEFEVKMLLEKIKGFSKGE
ncbi:hypothetical protein P6P35_00790 [Clostridium perfringens]|nr:hypothetical protein [Clostridium perfringens]